MKLWKKLKSLFSFGTGNPVAPEWGMWFTGTNGTNLAVNQVTALQLPPFKRALDLIGSTVGRIPLNILEEGPDDSRTPATDHPCYSLLMDRANDYLTAEDWKFKIAADSVASGNGWGLIQRDPLTYRPIALHVLDPSTTYLTYKWQQGKAYPDDIFVNATSPFGGQQVYPYSDVIHIKGFPRSVGLMGHSLYSICSEAIGLGLAQIKYSTHYYGNDSVPGAVIEVADNLNPTQVKALQSQFTERSGVGNAGSIKVLGNGAHVNYPPLDPRKMELNQSIENMAILIADITGLPASKLNCRINNSYNSEEAMNLAMFNDFFDFLFCKIESECEAKLLTEAEKKSKRYEIEFDRHNLTHCDNIATTDSLLKQLDSGALLMNEFRRIKARPTFGADGDRPRITTNVTFADLPQFDPKQLEKQAQQEAEAKANAAAQAKANAAAQAQQQQPAEDQGQQQDKLKKVAASLSARFCKRLLKSLQSKRLDGDFYADHLQTLKETFAPFGESAQQTAVFLFGNLTDELKECLPEQYTVVLGQFELDLQKEMK